MEVEDRDTGQPLPTDNPAADLVKDKVFRQRVFYAGGVTRAVSYRIEQLVKLKEALRLFEEDIFIAQKKDMRVPKLESYGGSVMVLNTELKLYIKKLKRWARPVRVKTPMLLFKARSSIHYEPYGNTLIIGAWNAPIITSMLPLVGAIAAGNCVILKPSELAPASSAVIKRIIESCLDPDLCTVVEGGPDISTSLLKEKFDLILFTGSTHVGRIVARAAAENLVPTILEMGGKSPCLVDKDANLEIAARRITWAKFINCGQVCTAPDYVAVHKSVKEELLELIIAKIKKFYGDDPRISPDYCRIINKRHFLRLKELLDQGRIISGGDVDETNLYIAPTVVDGIDWDDDIMKEEIFGPILPVIEYEDLDDVIDRINGREKPLALYIYTGNNKTAQKIISSTSSGGVCVNTSIMHFFNPFLPFGGVGKSGMGKYRGKVGFKSFSHRKSVLRKSTGIDFDMLYPPYNDKTIDFLRRI